MTGHHPWPPRKKPPRQQTEAERQEAWLAQRRGRTEHHRKWSEFR